MISVHNVVAVVRMLLEFGAVTSLTKVVLSRRGIVQFQRLTGSRIETNVSVRNG